MTFGEVIKKYRKEKKLTQKELANIIGKSYSLVQKYELGLTQPPLDVLIKLCQVLDIPLKNYMSDESLSLFYKSKAILFDNQPIKEPDMTQSIEGAQKLVSQLDDFSKELQKSYDKLNNDGKQAVNEYAEYLSTQEKYKK